MKLTFRQGIARHQTDISGNPIFLQRSGANGQFIDLIVSPTPTVLVFAHREGTYVVEELKTVLNAWGPISSGTTYLYWDVNLLNAALTRGMTLLPPIYSSAAPSTPATDQHWFDTVENVMRVWNGTKWTEKIRLFAGYITSGAIVHPSPTGSQAGLIGDFEGGNIVLDSFGMPLRQSNGCFVTTSSWLNVVNAGTITTRLESIVMSGMAAEELPKFSLVQLRPGRKMLLARSTDYTSRISGIIQEDLYEGEVTSIITTGVVKNQEWSWPDNKINKPLFCGPTGEVTVTPPTTGVLQQIGFVYDNDAIFLDIKQPVVLDNPVAVVTPPSPPAAVPIADFTASVTSGTAPLLVQFESTSLNANALQWDFMNNGFVDSTELNPTHTYSTPGTYTVRHKAINLNGSDEMIKWNFITVAAPNSGAGNVNLGLSFSAPSRVTGGATFAFQVVVTNDGLANATNVQRELKLRTSNGTAVTLVNVPAGVTVMRAGAITRVTLPAEDIPSGTYKNFTLEAQVSPTATAIQIEGTASSLENDPSQQDNSASITIGVTP